MNSPPRTFFHYRKFDLNTLEALVHDTLHFSLPSQFNDPFDSRPTFACDSTLPELRSLLELLVQRRVTADVQVSLERARLQDDKAKLYAARLAAQQAAAELADVAYHATNPDYEEGPDEAEKWLLTNEIERELLQHYGHGVCCFSADYKNPLLWSHYADQHKGLCIGYATRRAPKPDLQRVIYGGARAIKTSLIVKAFCSKDQNAHKTLDRNVLLRKAKEWKYEQEWRLIGRSGSAHSPMLMTDITFGLRCSEAVRYSVVRSVGERQKPVTFYEMRSSVKDYSLRRAAVDLDDLTRTLPKVAESGVEMFDLLELQDKED